MLPKLVAMGTSLEESEKNEPGAITLKYLPFGEKIVKIGPEILRYFDSNEKRK